MRAGTVVSTRGAGLAPRFPRSPRSPRYLQSLRSPKPLRSPSRNESKPKKSSVLLPPQQRRSRRQEGISWVSNVEGGEMYDIMLSRNKNN